jgi:hypothetical protein
MIAALAAVLLLPTLGRAQQPATTPAQQAPSTAPKAPAAQQGQAMQEKAAEAPIAPVLSGPYPVMSKAALDRGRALFEMFNHVQTTELWDALTPNLRTLTEKQAAKQKGPSGKEAFATVNKKLREAMGPETQMIEENMVPYLYAPDTIYSRLSMYGKTHLPVMITIIFNQRGEIDDFPQPRPMQTIAEGRYAGYEDTAKLKLPFEGEWLVYHGGRNIFQNPYSAADDTRFAMDFVYLKNGQLFTGAGGVGSKAEDYYCFGQPILAPADGTVVRAVAGYDDVPTGKPNGDAADGNMIIISHDNGESSMFNHLKQNSLKVKNGDKVKQGDVIAACGNSGAGGIPHVHYQFEKGRGAGLPAQFNDYYANGKLVELGEPTRGQMVKNAAPGDTSATAETSAAPTSTASKPATATAKPAGK